MRYGSRAPVAVRIARAEAKLADLDQRIGRLMAQRVEIEEALAEMYRIRQSTT